MASNTQVLPGLSVCTKLWYHESFLTQFITSCSSVPHWAIEILCSLVEPIFFTCAPCRIVYYFSLFWWKDWCINSSVPSPPYLANLRLWRSYWAKYLDLVNIFLKKDLYTSTDVIVKRRIKHSQVQGEPERRGCMLYLESNSDWYL